MNQEMTASPTTGAPPEAVRVRFAGKVTTYGSYREASEAWSRFRDESGLGASEMPGVPEILGADGQAIGYVSYNGRVWPGRPQDWHAGLQPLYDNRLEEAPMATDPASAAEGPALTQAARAGYFGNANPHAPRSPLWLAHALGEHLHREGFPPPGDARIDVRQGLLESRGVVFRAIEEGEGVRLERDFSHLPAEPDAEETEDRPCP